MKKFISIIIVFSFFSTSNAQEDNYDINGFSVGIVPSALLNVWTGFQGEINYGFADHFEVSINAGFLYGKRRNNSYDGYRIRPSLKYYFLNDLENFRFYLEAGYMYRVTNEKFLASYNMFQGAFRQELINNRKREIEGLFAMFGSRSTVKDTRVYIDYGIGIGFGSITVVNGQIDNAEPINDFNFFGNNDDGTLPFPIFILHLAVGYDF